jgi:hypothetical protein
MGLLKGKRIWIVVKIVEKEIKNNVAGSRNDT